LGPTWETAQPDLDAIVLAYLEGTSIQARQGEAPAGAASEGPR
jgi:hypothetical protein